MQFEMASFDRTRVQPILGYRTHPNPNNEPIDDVQRDLHSIAHGPPAVEALVQKAIQTAARHKFHDHRKRLFVLEVSVPVVPETKHKERS